MAFQATGRFTVIRLVGSGGMGTVFEVLDTTTGERLALKRLNSSSEGDALLSFKNEFRFLADLQHPNLVRLHELFSDTDGWYFTMEYVNGVDFLSYVSPRTFNQGESESSLLLATPAATERRKLESASPLDLAQSSRSWFYYSERLMAALAQLCSGVHALHQLGLVHRDLKPSNALVTEQGKLLLLDFGLARPTSSQHAGSSALQGAGTVAYMAPEQARGGGSEAADWYAVGIMLYEALTGRLPFLGTRDEVLAKKQTASIVPPKVLNPKVSAALDGLCGAMIRPNPAERPSFSEIISKLRGETRGIERFVQPPGLPPDEPGAFVGRGPELAQLSEHWARVVASGEPLVTFVTGASGLGKSALVRHFLRGLTQQPLATPQGGTDPSAPERVPPLVLHGRSSERESVPFKVFDAVVDQLSEVLAGLSGGDLGFVLPNSIQYLAAVFPVLWRVRPLNEPRYRAPPIPERSELRRRAFDALRTLLSNLGRLRPVVLALDDLQWADHDSIELFNELFRPSLPAKLLIVATVGAAGAELPSALSWLAEAAFTRSIDLPRLTDEEGTQLMTALLKATRIPREEVARLASTLGASLVNQADGNPLYLRELLRHSQGAGAGAGAQSGAEGASIGLEELLRERIRGLPETCRRLLTFLAVAGDPISQDVLSRAAELSVSEKDWSRSLSVLRSERMLRRSGTRGSDHLEPAHGRIRSAVIGQLDQAEKARIHRKLADALKADPQPRVDLLATHLLEAGNLLEAKDSVIEAARAANRKLAFGRAAELLRRAVDIETEPRARASLQMELGDTCVNLGQPAKAIAAYRIASESPDTALKTVARRLTIKHLLRAGHLAEGVEAIPELAREAALWLPSTPRMALLSLVLTRVLGALRGLRYTERPEERLAPETVLRLDSLWLIAQGLSFCDLIRGKEATARYVRLALGSGDTKRIALALAGEAAQLAPMGGRSLDRALRVGAEAELVAARAEDPIIIGSAMIAILLAHYFSGAWKKAFEYALRTEEFLLTRCQGVGWEIANTRNYLCNALMRRGELGELGRKYDTYVAQARQAGDWYFATTLRTRFNVVWLARGDLDRARAETEGALATWPNSGYHLQHLYHLFARCDQHLYEQKPELAAEAFERETSAVKRSHLLRVQMLRVEFGITRARIALVMAARSHGAEKLRQIRKARRSAQRLRREGPLFASAAATYLFAQAASVGDPDAPESATQQLDQAIAELLVADLNLFAAAAKRVKGRLVGGETGARLAAEADQWMASRSVANPGHLALVLGAPA